MPYLGMRKGPLPEGHPFKGTRIIFGMKRPDISEKNLTEEKQIGSIEDVLSQQEPRKIKQKKRGDYMASSGKE